MELGDSIISYHILCKVKKALQEVLSFSMSGRAKRIYLATLAAVC